MLRQSPQTFWPSICQITPPQLSHISRPVSFLRLSIKSVCSCFVINLCYNQPHDLKRPVITTPAILPIVAIPVPSNPISATTTAGLFCFSLMQSISVKASSTSFSNRLIRVSWSACHGQCSPVIISPFYCLLRSCINPPHALPWFSSLFININKKCSIFIPR